VQVPAQTLLGPPPLGEQVVAVIEQQLELAQPLLAGTRVVEARLAQRRPGDRERVERVGRAAHAGRADAPERSAVAARARAARPPPAKAARGRG
jgi:hypothetical protein